MSFLFNCICIFPSAYSVFNSIINFIKIFTYGGLLFYCGYCFGLFIASSYRHCLSFYRIFIMYLVHFNVTEYHLTVSNIHYQLRASDHQQKNDANPYLVYNLWFHRFIFCKHFMFTHRKHQEICYVLYCACLHILGMRM